MCGDSAGLAGLAAAYRLTQENWKVTVLEADERLGGRVMTYHFDGAPETSLAASDEALLSSIDCCPIRAVIA